MPCIHCFNQISGIFWSRKIHINLYVYIMKFCATYYIELCQTEIVKRASHANVFCQSDKLSCRSDFYLLSQVIIHSSDQDAYGLIEKP